MDKSLIESSMKTFNGLVVTITTQQPPLWPAPQERTKIGTLLSDLHSSHDEFMLREPV